MNEELKRDLEARVLRLKEIDDSPISEFTEALKIQINEIQIANNNNEAILYFKELVKINCLSAKILGWF